MDELPLIGVGIFFFTYIIFIAVIVKNLINLLKKRQESRFLGIYFLTLIFIVVIYYFDIERNLNFAMNYRARQEVVNMIVNGDLTGKGSINLP